MSGTFVGNGRCLCGVVQITAENVHEDVVACHCRTCRRWGGGPLFSTDCGSEVTFSGEENITVYDSSPWAERGFCRKCGSHLFYRIKQNQQHIVPVGLFEDDSQFVFDRQVFIDEKPAYYHFGNETKAYTGEEIFKMFGSASK